MCQVAESYLGRKVEYKVWMKPPEDADNVREGGKWLERKGTLVAIDFEPSPGTFFFLVEDDDGSLATLTHFNSVRFLKNQ